MKKSTKAMSFIIVLLSLLSIPKISTAIDTINTTQILRDGGDTLVSSGGVFELGFFSPGNSRNRYVGIWYKKIHAKTVVWVANKENPLTSVSGILKVIESGVLALLNNSNNIIWSSNTSTVTQNPILQLLDSGNLVLREEMDDNPENFLWQSFEYLSDTILPSMRFGFGYVTGRESYLSSWKTNEDPSPGNFTFHLDPTGYPQGILKRGNLTVCRIGPWNGIRLSGAPNANQDLTFAYSVSMSKNRIYSWEEAIDKSVITRTTLSQSGVVQRWTWIERIQDWVVYLNVPADICDTYKLCGAYGRCNIGNSPSCRCLDKFVPKDTEGWIRSDWSNGCIRRTPLNCSKGDVFLKYSGIKLPDSRYSWFTKNLTIEECKVACLKNCSCTAYTQLDISRKGSGCLFWFGDLVDIRDFYVNGQDIHIRMSSSELDTKGKRRKTLILSFTSLMGVILLGVSSMLYYWKKKKSYKKRISASRSKDNELPLFDFSTISKATNNFSINNKLGQGGYGPVYEGMLENGQEIAIKRLSKTSMQGLDEFMNEVLCIAKLQHRNLVKLLGCCIQGEEKMLIYEYMPNKSLDLILFDQTRSTLLDWPKRLQVVNGVARGLMYIHQDSRLRIIHRDLKASNILLDINMAPKISDFGIARTFRENETEVLTSRVVGTYGYMAPEYAVHGRFSVKSDVFSFGVLVLEIVSGKRNSGFSAVDQHLNLLGHAWTLYKDGRSLELINPYLRDSAKTSEVLRLIHMGLLCVQQCPDDRPSMATVVAMLDNEITLPPANQPGFFAERDAFVTASIASNSSNGTTITQLEPR